MNPEQEEQEWKKEIKLETKRMVNEFKKRNEEHSSWFEQSLFGSKNKIKENEEIESNMTGRINENSKDKKAIRRQPLGTPGTQAKPVKEEIKRPASSSSAISNVSSSRPQIKKSNTSTSKIKSVESVEKNDDIKNEIIVKERENSSSDEAPNISQEKQNYSNFWQRFKDTEIEKIVSSLIEKDSTYIAELVEENRNLQDEIYSFEEKVRVYRRGVFFESGEEWEKAAADFGRSALEEQIEYKNKAQESFSNWIKKSEIDLKSSQKEKAELDENLSEIIKFSKRLLGDNFHEVIGKISGWEKVKFEERVDGLVTIDLEEAYNKGRDYNERGSNVASIFSFYEQIMEENSSSTIADLVDSISTNLQLYAKKLEDCNKDLKDHISLLSQRDLIINSKNDKISRLEERNKKLGEEVEKGDLNFSKMSKDNASLRNEIKSKNQIIEDLNKTLSLLSEAAKNNSVDMMIENFEKKKSPIVRSSSSSSVSELSENEFIGQVVQNT